MISLSSLRADMEAQIKASKEALLATKRKPRQKPATGASASKGGAADGCNGSVALAVARNFASGARTALALDPNTTLASALSKVIAANGPLNWLLVTPALTLIEAGAGSVAQMRDFLKARI